MSERCTSELRPAPLSRIEFKRHSRVCISAVFVTHLMVEIPQTGINSLIISYVRIYIFLCVCVLVRACVCVCLCMCACACVRT